MEITFCDILYVPNMLQMCLFSWIQVCLKSLYSHGYSNNIFFIKNKKVYLWIKIIKSCIVI